MNYNQGQFRRKNYFIEKKFQSRFILKFCGLVIFGGLLTIAALYFLAMRSTTVAIVNSQVTARTTADFILPILIQTVLVVMVLSGLAVIALTLFVSHKIAGPLFRFKKVLNNLETGDFSSDFHIRNFDQLQDLARDFNEMIAKIRYELNLLKASSGSLKEKINHFSEADVLEYKRRELAELKKEAEELQKIISYFKS